MNGPILNIVAVSEDRHRKELLDALTGDQTDFGVVVVESIERGYSRIKEMVPDMVIVYCGIDDYEACQLLSMLSLDARLSSVPVVTCLRSQLN